MSNQDQHFKIYLTPQQYRIWKEENLKLDVQREHLNAQYSELAANNATTYKIVVLC